MYALFKDGKPYSEAFEDLSDLWLMYADFKPDENGKCDKFYEIFMGD